MPDRLPGGWATLTALLFLGSVVVLLGMGRPPICTCGTVSLWHGAVYSSGNSQHLTDWYTPSHLVHGFLLYAVLAWLMPRQPIGLRLFVATLIEVAWEIAENTDWVINRYRSETIALDFVGDSVINSSADILAMLLGFALARVLPVWASVATVLVAEIGVLLAIRDNLTLNVIMLVWPLESIKAWQSAAGPV